MSDNNRLKIDATPIQICGSAIVRLSDVWDEMADRAGGTKGVFIERIFGGICAEDKRGEDFEAELDRWDEQPEDMKPFVLLQAMFICGAYAYQAMKAYHSEEDATAIGYTHRCTYWLGMVCGTWGIRKTIDDPIRQFSKRGADARHAETRAMKADVFQWLDANKMPDHRSMDSVAEAIAGKIVPIKFRTAHDWVSEWKKLRSAGKP